LYLGSDTRVRFAKLSIIDPDAVVLGRHPVGSAEERRLKAGMDAIGAAASYFCLFSEATFAYCASTAR
jgi:hypothetical protein